MQNMSRTDNSPVYEPHYWAVENIRTRTGLGDLSIAARNQLPYGVPDMLFNIYIEHGIAKVATRPYPSYMDKTWTDRFEIGEAKAVAMAFDGYWRMYQLKWRMITDDYPNLFWVDNSNKLYVQIWDDVSTKFELSSNVVKMKAIRAWKNVSYPDRDHGIVCAYIKTDGKAYYRSYCYQEIDDSFAWENEVEIEEFTGTAVNLNLFITNDYRTGIVIEDSLGKITWLITGRNWAGMAIAPEYISVAPIEVRGEFRPLVYVGAYEDEYLSVAPSEVIGDLRYALTDNFFKEIYNEPVEVYDEELETYRDDWGKVLIFTTNQRLYSINPQGFEIRDNLNRAYYPDGIVELANVEKDGLYKYRLDFLGEKSFNNVDDIGTLKFTGINTLNGVEVPYEPFEKVFYPQNLEPEFIPIPEVDGVWNE